MKKSTLMFGLAFALLLSYVLLVEKKNFSKFEPPSRQGPKLFSIKQDDIRYFKIENGKTIIAFRKNKAGEWQMEKPLVDSADPVQCDSLARSVANLNDLGDIEKKENLKDYGFSKVSIKVHVEGDGFTPIDMQFGDEDPTSKGTYAYFTNNQKIALVPNFIKQMANKPIAEWRNPAPVHFDQDKIQACSFASPGVRLTFNKNEDNWFMTSPVKEDADADKVQQLLVTFLSIRGMHFVPVSDIKPFSPFATLTIKEQDKKPTVISIRRNGDNYLVLPPGRAYGVLTTNQFLKDLKMNPSTYEDLHLVRFNDRLITRVDVVKKNKLYQFEKNGSDWTLLHPEKSRIPPWKAVSILSDLRTIKIEKGSPPAAFNAQVSLKLWTGGHFVGTVYIGDRVKMHKKDFYPARVTPTEKTGMIDAGQLLHDLP